MDERDQTHENALVTPQSKKFDLCPVWDVEEIKKPELLDHEQKNHHPLMKSIFIALI